jgi:hypothetical protein
MVWNVGQPKLAAIVATSSTKADPLLNNGTLGQGNTTVLLGSGSYSYGDIQGGRVTLGLATGCLPPIEFSGFWAVKPDNTLLAVASNGSVNSPVLARPFLAPNLQSINGLGQESILSAGFPGRFAGSITVDSSASLWGFEINGFLNLGESDCAGLDFLLGYRYANFGESLSIANSLQPVANATIPFPAISPVGFGQGFQSVVTDSFKTINQFNGANLGLRSSVYFSKFTATLDLKLALGATSERLEITGQSQLFSPASFARGAQTVPGGLLAVASNSGDTSHNAFSVIPEANFNIGFNITRCVKLFATYNIFYWDKVVRPGDQLNSVVDSRQVPASANYNPNVQATVPGVPFAISNFWGQGVSLGVEIGF